MLHPVLEEGTSKTPSLPFWKFLIKIATASVNGTNSTLPQAIGELRNSLIILIKMGEAQNIGSV